MEQPCPAPCRFLVAPCPSTCPFHGKGSEPRARLGNNHSSIQTKESCVWGSEIFLLTSYLPKRNTLLLKRGSFRFSFPCLCSACFLLGQPCTHLGASITLFTFPLHLLAPVRETKSGADLLRSALLGLGLWAVLFCFDFFLFIFLLCVLFVTRTSLGSPWGCFTPQNHPFVLSTPLWPCWLRQRRLRRPVGESQGPGGELWPRAMPGLGLYTPRGLHFPACRAPRAAGSSGEAGAKPFAYTPRHAPAAALRGERSAERPRRLLGNVVPAAVGRSGRAAGGDVASVT